jgi:GxxExxY protein
VTERVYDPVPADVELLAKNVVDAAYRVHKALGPGLLESVYEVCLGHELRQRGLSVATQVALPVVYDGTTLDAGLRLDMLVADCLIVEVKSVETMNPVFKAQLLTYLKLSSRRLGLLINFNVPIIKNVIKRVVL